MGKKVESKDYYGWKFPRGWFTDPERERLRKNDLAFWVATFIEDLCNREREIMQDPEIPEGRSLGVILAHRANARDQLLKVFLKEIGFEDDSEATEGFIPATDD